MKPLTDTEKESLQLKIDIYGDMVYRLALSQVKNPTDAQDIVQEVFYQYIKRRGAFDSAEHEKAWLLRVTLNACKKLWRSAWYRRVYPFGEQEEAVQEGSLEADVLAQERRAAVVQAVFLLPAKYREVIHLFYFEELSVKEICRILDRKESTVTSQLTRGRDMLRKNLEEMAL